MLLEKELDKWVKGETKYITMFYLIKSNVDKQEITLYYKYEKDDDIIENKGQAEVGLDYNLSKVELNNFLEKSNNIFHKLIAEHIEEFWEQELFTETPSQSDTFEIAYYSTHVAKIQDGINANRKVIITDGKRRGDQILSTDEVINLEEKKDNIRIIGWCHK